MSNSPRSEFPYWQERLGTVGALEQHYPDAIKDSPLIATAIANLELAKLALEASVNKYFNENPDPFEDDEPQD